MSVMRSVSGMLPGGCAILLMALGASALEAQEPCGWCDDYWKTGVGVVHEFCGIDFGNQCAPYWVTCQSESCHLEWLVDYCMGPHQPCPDEEGQIALSDPLMVAVLIEGEKPELRELSRVLRDYPKQFVLRDDQRAVQVKHACTDEVLASIPITDDELAYLVARMAPAPSPTQ